MGVNAHGDESEAEKSRQKRNTGEGELSHGKFGFCKNLHNLQL